MNDALFPSGPWVGFYTYASPADKHRMDLFLTFAGGKMTGDGNDDVGRFGIQGHYDAESRECEWTKHYLGAHAVDYRGYREGKGIWGRWEIPPGNAHGGFHIWPSGADEGEAQTKAAGLEAPVEAVGQELTTV